MDWCGGSKVGGRQWTSDGYEVIFMVVAGACMHFASHDEASSA